MNTRNRMSLVAAIAAMMVLPAMAFAWPEAHSGAYLGVQIAPVTPQQASSLKLQNSTGALITYVDQDGPACHAGLLENDVVVAYEGSKIEAPSDLQGLIHATPPQKTVTLTVVRGGQRKDVKVTLGSWNIIGRAHNMDASTLAVPPPPHVFVPEVDVPSFTLLSSHHGLVVESLSPQLADFFGVPHGHGVLVRSVESGSPAAAAGLKAGDVILKVNNEMVHDMVDWQRGMRNSGNKLPVNVWRDRREQIFILNVPTQGDSSRLSPSDSLHLDTDAQLLRQQIGLLGPEIERAQEETAQLGPDAKEMERMRRDLEKGMKKQQKDMAKMARDMGKSARPLAKDMKKMSADLQKSLPSQKEVAEMQRQIRESMPSAKDMEELQRQIQASVPSQKELDDMRQQMQDAMKSWTPQLQKQMEELRKQMEQHKFDWQQMMQDRDDAPEF
jgi:serine protease Do